MLIDQPKPRRRSLGRFLWPLAITAAAVVAVVITSAGDDTRAEFEYLGELHESASELSIGADSLRVVISRLARIERSELETATNGLREDLEIALELVERGPTSSNLVGANAVYRRAVEAWTVGVSGFASGILTAADDPTSTVVSDNIANALAELRAGDRLYSDLLRELEAEEVPDPVAPMPEILMLPAEGELFTLSLAYVEAARSPNSGIALRPGLRVASITSDPLWNVDPNDQAIVPATEQLTFSVVVDNAGNIPSEPEPIELTLVGESDPVIISETIPALEPGQQTAIRFLEVPVTPGTLYEVAAALTDVTNDIDLEDNTLTVLFEVNDE
jgi:hypothetical protein